MSASFFAATTAICFFCFLFSFFINCPFASSCCASRDYANDVLSAYGEHHKKNDSGSDGGQHDEAAFLIAMQLVPHGQREWVGESKRGGVEINSVFSEIRLAFSLVPLESHGSL